MYLKPVVDDYNSSNNQQVGARVHVEIGGGDLDDTSSRYAVIKFRQFCKFSYLRLHNFISTPKFDTIIYNLSYINLVFFRNISEFRVYRDANYNAIVGAISLLDIILQIYLPIKYIYLIIIKY